MFKFHKAVPLNNWNPYALVVGAKTGCSDDDTEMYLMIHDDDDSTVRLEHDQLLVVRNLLLEMCPLDEGDSPKAGMTLSEALQHLRDGKKIRRKAWNAEDAWFGPGQPLNGWVLREYDLLAEDWEVVE